MFIEICGEHKLPLWFCAIDFEKAFDSIEHSYLWQSLVDQGVDRQYVLLLAALYENQCGHVCGALSKAFKILRGTKQGDPLSPTLFNAALEKVMGQLQISWQAKGWGALVHNEGGRRFEVCWRHHDKCDFQAAAAANAWRASQEGY